MKCFIFIDTWVLSEVVMMGAGGSHLNPQNFGLYTIKRGQRVGFDPPKFGPKVYSDPPNFGA